MTIKINPGDVYGRWTIVGLGKVSGKRKWLCRCQCGSEGLVLTHDLTSGHSSSCGCYGRERRAEASTKHGYAREGKKTPAYRVWEHMIKRCHSASDDSYQYYGGRGIQVCEAWRADFTDFLRDMGEPSPGEMIERDDVNGNYEPGNCRWATRVEQMNNKRSNIMIATIEGVMTMAEFAKRYNLNYKSVKGKIGRGATEISGIKFRIAGRRDNMRPPPPEEMSSIVARKFGVDESVAAAWLSRLAAKIRANQMEIPA